MRVAPDPPSLLPPREPFSSLHLFQVHDKAGRLTVRDGLRMLCIGAAAGAMTYFIGKLLGVNMT